MGENDSNALSIELLKEGYTVVRTTTGDLNDFLIFEVETAISPGPKQIGVGDILVLQELVNGIDEGKGKWTSEPNGIIQIFESDYAMAIKSGNARISYHLSGSDAQVSVYLYYFTCE